MREGGKGGREEEMRLRNEERSRGDERYTTGRMRGLTDICFMYKYIYVYTKIN